MGDGGAHRVPSRQNPLEDVPPVARARARATSREAGQADLQGLRFAQVLHGLPSKPRLRQNRNFSAEYEIFGPPSRPA